MATTTPTPTPKMTVLNYLDILKQVVGAIELDLIDNTTGGFKAQPDYKDDAALIADVVKAYETHGGTVNPNVEKVLAGLGVLLEFVK